MLIGAATGRLLGQAFAEVLGGLSSPGLYAPASARSSEGTQAPSYETT